jgi:hypothetical protein
VLRHSLFPLEKLKEGGAKVRKKQPKNIARIALPFFKFAREKGAILTGDDKQKTDF